MKGYVKLILIVVLIVVLLASYKLISINGFVEFVAGEQDVINTIITAKKVYYYDRILNNKDKTIYTMIVETKQDELKLMYITASDMQLYTGINAILDNDIVKKVTPLPWWIALIVFFVIICIPPPNYYDEDTVIIGGKNTTTISTSLSAEEQKIIMQHREIANARLGGTPLTPEEQELLRKYRQANTAPIVPVEEQKAITQPQEIANAQLGGTPLTPEEQELLKKHRQANPAPIAPVKNYKVKIRMSVGEKIAIIFCLLMALAFIVIAVTPFFNLP